MRERLTWGGDAWDITGSSDAFRRGVVQVKAALIEALREGSMIHGGVGPRVEVYHQCSHGEIRDGWATMTIEASEAPIYIRVSTSERGRVLLDRVRALIPSLRDRFDDPTIALVRVE